jgi:hypothetical protein|tara:strand:- start:626 stop:1033 length:408 start_codon:yes stop_codon:yes gene_type:complete
MKTVEEMLKELEFAVNEMVTVPNSWLPEKFHNKRDGGRSLAELNEMCEDMLIGETEYQKIKSIKTRNIEKLRKQVEEKSIFNTHKGGTDFVDLSGELGYSDNEADEIQLHRNMAALVGGMVNGGLIDAEDLGEEV